MTNFGINLTLNIWLNSRCIWFECTTDFTDFLGVIYVIDNELKICVNPTIYQWLSWWALLFQFWLCYAGYYNRFPCFQSFQGKGILRLVGDT